VTALDRSWSDRPAHHQHGGAGDAATHPNRSGDSTRKTGMATMSAKPRQTNRRYHRRSCVPAAAATLRRSADRQRLQQRRPAHVDRGLHRPRSDRARLRAVEDRAHVADHPVRARPRVREHSHQRCLPALRRDGPERLPRRTQHQRGRRASRTDGDHPRRRPTSSTPTCSAANPHQSRWSIFVEDGPTLAVPCRERRGGGGGAGYHAVGWYSADISRQRTGLPQCAQVIVGSVG